MQAFCRNRREAAVDVAKDEHRIGLASDHELVAAIDDVTDGCTEVVTNGVHVDFGILEAQVLEEHAVQVVVVILARVRQDAVKILAALVDHGGKADDFGTRPFTAFVRKNLFTKLN